MANQIQNKEVVRVFESYPAKARSKLLQVRNLILKMAKSTPGVGPIEECLRWGEPSYLTTETGSGSIIRIHCKDRSGETIHVYFHCQTKLISSFRRHYGDKLVYEDNRALVFNVKNRIPITILNQCIRQALTYKLRR